MVQQDANGQSYDAQIANIDATLERGTRITRKYGLPKEQTLTVSQEARLRHQKAILEARKKRGSRIDFRKLGVPSEDQFRREIEERRRKAQE